MIKKIIVLSALSVLYVLFFPERALAAKLYLEPPTGNYGVGQQFQSRIMLDTEQKAVAGADAFLTFNPSILKAVKIEKGAIFNQYLGINIDNENGSLSASGIISLDNDAGWSGSGVFATIVFEGLSTGTSQIVFDFTQGSKNDSNIAVLDSTDDQLTSASGATYTIKSGSSENDNKGSDNDTPAAPTTPAELPKSGSISNTVKALFAGIGTIVLALLLL